MVTIIIFAVTIAAMITGILVFPKIKFGRVSIDSYWLITLLGAALMLVTGQGDIKAVGSALIADNAINPLKILVLFISMTVLSIFLDELGFFSYLANVTMKRAKASQKKLFMYLYITVSVLTVFTSNDIIILSFTPFICYFAKNAKISPIPYLAAEFVAANTWSMALIIGNPTNIYLATAFGIGFGEYVKVMILPTLLAGLTAFGMLYLLFRRQLSAQIKGNPDDVRIKDRALLTVGLIHLGACTAALAVSSYIGLEMWLISLGAALSLFICALIISAIRRKAPVELGACLKRAPWQLIPFIISMFTMIILLSGKGYTAKIAELLGNGMPVLKYGSASFLAANVINNIPMSVLFCSVIDSVPESLATQAVFATVVGSNLGALLSPIGALAGIMWSSILTRHDLKYGYLDFLKTGVIVGIPTLAVCLAALAIIV